MAELDYDALQRLADAATPGPWTSNGVEGNLDSGDTRVAEVTMWRYVDERFIVAARSAVPVLLARVRELEAAAKLSHGLLAIEREEHEETQEQAERLEAERDAALSTIAKVRVLHQPYEGASGKWCRHCVDFDGPWPCSTAVALGIVPSTGEGNA